MNFEDLVDVLRRINRGRDHHVDDDLLKSVVALVMKNPLDEDRGRCQDQLAHLIINRAGGAKDAN